MYIQDISKITNKIIIKSNLKHFYEHFTTDSIYYINSPKTSGTSLHLICITWKIVIKIWYSMTNFIALRKFTSDLFKNRCFSIYLTKYLVSSSSCKKVSLTRVFVISYIEMVSNVFFYSEWSVIVLGTTKDLDKTVSIMFIDLNN